MSMCLALHSVSDITIERIAGNPALIWRLIAPDDPEIYVACARTQNRVGFLGKLLGRKPEPTSTEIPDLELGEHEGLDDDLDKSWQGLHYCLNQTEYDAPSPMDFLTVGGEQIGDVDVGYGPARAISSTNTLAIESKLSQIPVELLRKNYDPVAMDNLDIYPQIWSRDGDAGFEYIAENFSRLKTFLSHCTTHKLGMVVYLS